MSEEQKGNAMNPLISIILPVYNGSAYMRESIESVLSQSFRDWELIIVDDCSTDDTAAIAKSYAEADARIVYYRNESNLKLPRNLNRGFSLSRGEYLTWTSDDNRFKANALETMLSALREHPSADLVYASYDVIDENGKKLHMIAADPQAVEHILGSNVVGACFLFTRKAYELTGEYDPELLYVEDFDYWQRMLGHVRSISIRESLYEYRWHGASMTSTKNQAAYGIALERMVQKNKKLYEPLSAKQRVFYLRLLKKSYEAQGKKNFLTAAVGAMDAFVRFVKKW